MLQREIFSLSSKAVHHTVIIFKIIEDKASQFLCMQDVHKHGNSTSLEISCVDLVRAFQIVFTIEDVATK